MKTNSYKSFVFAALFVIAAIIIVIGITLITNPRNFQIKVISTAEIDGIKTANKGIAALINLKDKSYTIKMCDDSCIFDKLVKDEKYLLIVKSYVVNEDLYIRFTGLNKNFSVLKKALNSSLEAYKYDIKKVNYLIENIPDFTSDNILKLQDYYLSINEIAKDIKYYFEENDLNEKFFRNSGALFYEAVTIEKNNIFRVNFRTENNPSYIEFY